MSVLEDYCIISILYKYSAHAYGIASWPDTMCGNLGCLIGCYILLWFLASSSSQLGILPVGPNSHPNLLNSLVNGLPMPAPAPLKQVPSLLLAKPAFASPGQVSHCQVLRRPTHQGSLIAKDVHLPGCSRQSTLLAAPPDQASGNPRNSRKTRSLPPYIKRLSAVSDSHRPR